MAITIVRSTPKAKKPKRPKKGSVSRAKGVKHVRTTTVVR